MKIIKTKIDGLCILEPILNEDGRGYFTRIFCENELRKSGIGFEIKQVNHSYTKKRGTIRGMHFQRAPKSEGKIVQCLRGKIYDVAVDLRKKSPTYRKWFAVELSAENKRMLHIPKGFAHGLQTLTGKCTVQYFMSEFYSPDHADGVRWDDPAFKITWPLGVLRVSERDKRFPLTIG